MATGVKNGQGSNGYHQGNGSSQPLNSIDTATPQQVFQRIKSVTNGHGSNGHLPQNGSYPNKKFSIETATEDEMYERVHSFPYQLKPDPCPEFTAYEEKKYLALNKEKELFWQETVPTIAAVTLIIIVGLGLLAVSVYAYCIKAPLTIPLK